VEELADHPVLGFYIFFECSKHNNKNKFLELLIVKNTQKKRNITVIKNKMLNPLLSQNE